MKNPGLFKVILCLIWAGVFALAGFYFLCLAMHGCRPLLAVLVGGFLILGAALLLALQPVRFRCVCMTYAGILILAALFGAVYYWPAWSGM